MTNARKTLLEQNIGKIITIGSYEFTEANIIRYAKKYDPQPFHLDSEAAKSSTFGALCASGWHIPAVWMQLNVQSITDFIKNCLERGETPPLFGPSPGFENLRWPNPVYAGDVIAYTAQIKSIRQLASRPGWSMLMNHATGTNQYSECVMKFDSAVLIKIPELT